MKARMTLIELLTMKLRDVFEFSKEDLEISVYRNELYEYTIECRKSEI